MAITRPIEAGTTFRTPIYTGRKDEAPYTDLSPTEIDAVNACLDAGFEHFAMTSPKLTSIYQAQREDILTWAGFAKAAMDNKVISYPSQPGGIGICWMNPQSIRSDAKDLAADFTEYNGWEINTHDIKLDDAGEDYLFGDATHYYKSHDTPGKRAISIVLKDGLIEIGTTPSFMLQRIISESDTQYGIISEPPTYTIPIERGIGLYVHKTLGMVPLWNDLGIKWTVLPLRDVTATLLPVGITFYEHAYLSTLVRRAAT